MAKNALFGPLQIAGDHIYYVDTSKPPAEAAKDYEEKIKAHFKPAAITFDLILLGLGDNSHTASLFPHTDVLHENNAVVKEVFVEELHQYRITLTAPVINNARNVIFLVYGEGKARAVHHIIEGVKDIEEYPAQLIGPQDGELYWMVDKAAAALLNKQ
jgi:6-phosphogluconolactonase